MRKAAQSQVQTKSSLYLRCVSFRFVLHFHNFNHVEVNRFAWSSDCQNRIHYGLTVERRGQPYSKSSSSHSPDGHSLSSPPQLNMKTGHNYLERRNEATWTLTSVKTSASSECTLVRREVLATSISISLSISFVTLTCSKTWRAFSFAASNPSVTIRGCKPWHKNDQKMNTSFSLLMLLYLEEGGKSIMNLWICLSPWVQEMAFPWTVLSFWIHRNNIISYIEGKVHIILAQSYAKRAT